MKTIIKILWHYLAGEGVREADDTLFNKRISICRANSCGYYKKPFNLKPLEKCGNCGCFLNLKARIDEPYIECPVKLW